jgi:hypothetical protein
MKNSPWHISAVTKKSCLLLHKESRILKVPNSFQLPSVKIYWPVEAFFRFPGKREHFNPGSPFAPKGSDKQMGAGLLTCIAHPSPSRGKTPVT